MVALLVGGAAISRAPSKSERWPRPSRGERCEPRVAGGRGILGEDRRGNQNAVNAAPLGAGIRPKLVPREWSDYSGALCAEQRNRRDRKKWGEVPTWCGARFGCGGPLG